MHYREVAPRPMLAQYIKCFWILRRDFPASGGMIDVLPDSYVDILFNSGADCRIEGASDNLPPCYLVTLLRQPLRLRSDGVLRTVGVRFFAWGYQPFVEREPAAGRAIHALDEPWQQLAEQLAQLDDEATLDTLQQFLLGHALALRGGEPALPRAAQSLFDHRGGLRIGVLADRAFVSRRQLERWFRQRVGVAPKALACRMRFEHVRDHLSRDPDADQRTLAQEYGYADQAHLGREFKHWSGRTPGRFAAEIRAVAHELRFGVAFPERTDRGSER